MKVKAVFFSVLFALTSLLGAERGWNSLDIAKFYYRNSEPQRSMAWELLGQFPIHFAQSVLDFGCGDGKITAQIARLLGAGTVTGVDLSWSMIELANIHFSSSDYRNLEFRQIDDPSQITGVYDVICAFCVFHFLDQPVRVLQALKERLAPGGRLLLTIPCVPQSVCRQAANETFVDYGLEQPWHLPNYSSKLSMRSLEGCKQKLEEAGYDILFLQTIDTPIIFHDLSEFTDWLIGTASANWGVPFDISRPFFNDVVTRMIELDPGISDERGCIFWPQARVHIIAVPKN